MHKNLNRFQAFGIHLSLSTLILGSFLLFVYLVWYPQPFFAVEGLVDIIWVLIGVDLVLGPALTLVVFNTDKPELKRDLSIIALIQLIGFFYGAHTMYTERPLFAVIYDSVYFEVLPASEVKDTSEIETDLKPGPFTRPHYVYAKNPKDPVVLKKILEEMKAGAPAIGRNPKYFRPLKGHISHKFKYSLDLESLDEIPANKAIIASFKSKYGERIGQLRFFRIIGSFTSRIVVIDIETETVVDFIDINPTLKEAPKPATDSINPTE